MRIGDNLTKEQRDALYLASLPEFEEEEKEIVQEKDRKEVVYGNQARRQRFGRKRKELGKW